MQKTGTSLQATFHTVSHGNVLGIDHSRMSQQSRKRQQLEVGQRLSRISLAPSRDKQTGVLQASPKQKIEARELYSSIAHEDHMFTCMTSIIKGV